MFNNTLKYLIGSDLNLTCAVTPTPPSNSVFNWSCSTGCFADMEMGQTISIAMLNESDSGEIICSFMFDGLQYESDPFNLQVVGECYCNNAVYIIVFCNCIRHFPKIN